MLSRVAVLPHRDTFTSYRSVQIKEALFVVEAVYAPFTFALCV